MAASGDWQPLFSEDIPPGLPYWLPVSFPWQRVVVMEVLLSHPSSESGRAFSIWCPCLLCCRVARSEGPSSALKPGRERDPFLSSLLSHTRGCPKAPLSIRQKLGGILPDAGKEGEILEQTLLYLLCCWTAPGCCRRLCAVGLPHRWLLSFILLITLSCCSKQPHWGASQIHPEPEETLQCHLWQDPRVPHAAHSCPCHCMSLCTLEENLGLHSFMHDGWG